jgi:hypothetical protein
MRDEIFKHPIWRQPEMGQFATMIEDMVTQTYYHSRDEWLTSATRVHRLLIAGWPRD